MAATLQGMIDTLSVNLDTVEGKIAALGGATADVAKKAAGGFAGLTGKITQMGGAITSVARNAVAGLGAAFAAVTPQITAAVEAFSPGHVSLMRQEIRNLSAAFGRLFVPAIERATEVIRKINEFITNLPEPLRKVIATVASLAAGLAVFSSLIPKLLVPFGFAFTFISAGLKALTADVVALDVASGGILPLIGLIATAFVGAGGAAAYFASQTEEGRSFFREVGDALKELWANLKGFLAELWGSAKPVFAQIGALARQLGAALVGVWHALKPLRELFAELLAKYLKAAAENFKVLAGVLSQILKRAIPAFAEGVRLAAAGVRALAGFLADLFRGGGAGGANQFKELLTSVGKAVVALADTFFRLRAAVLEALRPLLTGEGPLGRLGAVFRKFFEVIKPVFRFVLDVAVKALKQMIDLFSKLVILVGVLGEKILSGDLLGLADLPGILAEVEARFRRLSIDIEGGPGGRAGERERKTRTFAAGQAAYISVEEIGRRARLAAASAGVTDPQRQTAENTRRTADAVQVLAEQMPRWNELARRSLGMAGALISENNDRHNVRQTQRTHSR